MVRIHRRTSVQRRGESSETRRVSRLLLANFFTSSLRVTSSSLVHLAVLYVLRRNVLSHDGRWRTVVVVDREITFSFIFVSGRGGDDRPVGNDGLVRLLRDRVLLRLLRWLLRR